MYMNGTDPGLGKFKFKFKKLKKMLMKHPFAPTPIRLMQKFKNKKKSVGSPAPAVEPVYYQAPLPPPTPEIPEQRFYAPPQWRNQLPAPMPEKQTQWDYNMPESDYVPESSARDIPDQYYNTSSPANRAQESTFNYQPESDYPTENLPVVSAPEFEASNDAEYGWMEGLNEGASWGDIFTGAASELLANQRAKREAKSMAQQRAAMANYALPKSQGFNLNSMIMPLALAAGGFLLFKSMKKGR